MPAKKRKRKSRKTSATTKAMTWLQVIAAGLLCSCAASVYLSPAYCSLAGIFGIAFPVFLLFVLFAGGLSLLFAPKRVWISILGLLACSGSIRTYFPVNLTTPAPKTALKVVSYNTMSFGAQKKDADGNMYITNYIVGSKADIFCLQEDGCTEVNRRKAWQSICKVLPYRDSINFGKSNAVSCMSKFPIVKKEKVCSSKTNGSAAFFLLRGRKDTILIINNHLESLGLSPDERTNYSDIVLKNEHKQVRSTFSGILRKMAKSSVVRSKQADEIAAYLARHNHLPTIVAGDFNDTPISYTRYRIGEELTDCFRTSGNGFGRTYNRNAMFVRIDHIFCSSHFRPFSCHVDDDKEHSDHNPVVTYLLPDRKGN